jgi:hypothetical protein
MIDYQRLTPMPPSAKILGYLFGLPVREYLLFLTTVPFLAYAVWQGNMPVQPVCRYYLVFFCSVVLYHLAGLAAGTVLKKKAAGKTAQLLVVLLYFVIPRLSLLGFGAFQYFTVLPEFFQDLAPQMVLQDAEFKAAAPLIVDQNPNFFGIEFNITQFSLFIQAGLIIGFWTVLWRKWKRQEHHLLGKPFAAAGMAWLVMLMLGNSLPLIHPGKIFPMQKMIEYADYEYARFLTRQEQMSKDQEKGISRNRVPQISYGPKPSQQMLVIMPRDHWRKVEGSVVAGLYGIICLIGALLLVSCITPTADQYQAGLRRARKHGLSRAPPWTDEASALPWAVIIGAIGALSWIWFGREIFGSRWFSGALLTPASEAALCAAFMLPVICYQCVMEHYGRAKALLFAFVIWVVPVGVAVLWLVTGNPATSMHFFALSAIIMPFFALHEAAGLSAVFGEHGGQSAAITSQIGVALRHALQLHAALALLLVGHRLIAAGKIRQAIMAAKK